MKAFISRIVDGRTGIGSDNCFISNEYQSITALLRYSTRKLSTGSYLFEVFSNWDNRYGKADKVFEFTKHGEEI